VLVLSARHMRIILEVEEERTSLGQRTLRSPINEYLINDLARNETRRECSHPKYTYMVGHMRYEQTATNHVEVRIRHQRQCRDVVWDVLEVDGAKRSFITFSKRARKGPEVPIPIAVASWKLRGLSSAADEL